MCTFNQKSGITKMDEWINAKRPQKISTIGPGTSTSDIPKLLKAALNLPMDVIDGYKGGADARFAVESGEVDGYCGSWGTVETVWRGAYESKKILPVLQAALKSQSQVQAVSPSDEFRQDRRSARTAEDRRQRARRAISFHRAAGNGEGSAGALQRAFMQTFKDPDLIAEAKRSQLDIDPLDGPTIAKNLSGLYDLKPATVARLKEILLAKRK